jgi:hypothetical protein
MAFVPFQQVDPGSLFLERVLGYETGMGLVQPIQYSTPGVQTSPPLPGGVRGVRFPKIVNGPTGTAGAAAGVMSGVQTLGAMFIFVIPAAMTNGLQFNIQGIDDGTNPSDLGLNALFGIQTKVLVTGAYANLGIPNYATTSPFLNAPAGSGVNVTGQETSAVLTLGATSGLIATATISIITANLGLNAAANSTILCRLRRVGVAATDTLPGSVVVTGLTIGTY